MKKLYLLSLCFVIISCFSPLDHYNGRDNGDGAINVTLHSIQFLSGAPGSRVSSFPEDSYTVDDLDYTVIFTNTATNKVVAAVVTKSNDAVSASAVITPGRWRIDVKAKLLAGAQSPAEPGDTYALASETIDIQKDETINIQMKRAVKVEFFSEGNLFTTQFVMDGSLITRPQNPIRYLYTFKGWYKEAACTNEWIFMNDTVSYATSLTAPYILYAKWEDEVFQDGSSMYPYLVYDVITLKRVGKGTSEYAGWDLAKHYKQLADIDMSGQTWTVIGDNSSGDDNSRFTGVYNGDGYTITGLTINNPTGEYQGMFGFNSGDGITWGIVKNIGLIGGSITGAGYLGHVVGYNDVGLVQNCYTTGDVKGEYIFGGVVGCNDNGVVENCYSTGDVSQNIGSFSDTHGGVIGENFYGTVKNCYATGGIINGFHIVGGVVGRNYGTVENCFSTGNINASATVGGVVGDNQEGLIKNCYSTGSVNGETNIGGVLGTNTSDISILNNCYATGDVNGDDWIGGITGWNSGILENCYARGNVSCSNAFAGGITGVNGYKIKNCYATGDVSGDNYIGGIAGDNTYNQNIENCYATGAVSGNSKVGGIAGNNAGSIENCVALNPYIKQISGSDLDFGRIYGFYNDGNSSDNCARSDMKALGDIDFTRIGHDSEDGSDFTLGVSQSSVFSASRGWNTAIWIIPTGNIGNNSALPQLKDMPGNPVQDHTVTP